MLHQIVKIFFLILTNNAFSLPLCYRVATADHVAHVDLECWLPFLTLPAWCGNRTSVHALPLNHQAGLNSSYYYSILLNSHRQDGKK